MCSPGPPGAGRPASGEPEQQTQRHRPRCNLQDSTQREGGGGFERTSAPNETGWDNTDPAHKAGTIQTLPTRQGQYRPCPQGGDNTDHAHKAGTIQTLPTRRGQYRPCPQWVSPLLMASHTPALQVAQPARAAMSGLCTVNQNMSLRVDRSYGAPTDTLMHTHPHTYKTQSSETETR